jgi:hypothetical protein
MKIGRKPAVVTALVLILAGVMFFRHCSGNHGVTDSPGGTHNEGVTPSHNEALPENRVTEFLGMFETPIEIHGRVVDQHGDSVAEARVVITPVDTPFTDNSGSKLEITTDEEGRFHATGLRGASLGVEASKQGYMHRSPLGGPSSSAMVDYAGGAKAGERFRNPETPLVLELHNIGAVEPMVYIKKSRWKLNLDGTPRRIALDSVEGQGAHQIEFRLWSDTQIRRLPGNDVYTQFDWTFDARIPGGGFIWNDDAFSFQAPGTGYKESIRYHRPASMPREKWKTFENGRYFVKFPDGTHGRIVIDIDAGSDRAPLKITSWLNERPGSLNLASPYSDSSGFHGSDPEKQ